MFKLAKKIEIRTFITSEKAKTYISEFVFGFYLIGHLVIERSQSLNYLWSDNDNSICLFQFDIFPCCYRRRSPTLFCGIFECILVYVNSACQRKF